MQGKYDSCVSLFCFSAFLCVKECWRLASSPEQNSSWFGDGWAATSSLYCLCVEWRVLSPTPSWCFLLCLNESDVSVCRWRILLCNLVMCLFGRGRQCSSRWRALSFTMQTRERINDCTSEWLGCFSLIACTVCGLKLKLLLRAA